MSYCMPGFKLKLAQTSKFSCNFFLHIVMEVSVEYGSSATPATGTTPKIAARHFKNGAFKSFRSS